MFTLGLFGIGQLVDLALIPGMVEDKNLKYKLLHGNGNTPNNSNTPSVVINIGEHLAPFLNSAKTTTQNSDIQIILQLAKNNGGQVSLADCVIATGKPIGEVKDTIKTLCSEGLLDVGNEPHTGAVIYRII